MISPIEKLNNIEKEIQKAKLESDVYKRQLDELKPMRKQLEDESIEKYNCPIADLPAHKEKLEKQLEELVVDLEDKLNKAKKNNPIE